MANCENAQSCHRSLQCKWLNKVVAKTGNVKMNKVSQASYITYVVKEPKIPVSNYLLIRESKRRLYFNIAVNLRIARCN